MPRGVTSLPRDRFYPSFCSPPRTGSNGLGGGKLAAGRDYIVFVMSGKRSLDLECIRDNFTRCASVTRRLNFSPYTFALRLQRALCIYTYMHTCRICASAISSNESIQAFYDVFSNSQIIKQNFPHSLLHLSFFCVSQSDFRICNIREHCMNLFLSLQFFIKM